MKNRHLSYRWITGTVAGLTAFSGGNTLLQATSFAPLKHDAPERLSLGEFAFHHEAVLGTSMELIVHAGDAENASACEHQVLAEIERLRRILSTRDTASEISRVQKGSPIESRELAQVLAAYNVWSERTGGAINANMAGVVDLWKQAEREQRLPDSSSLVTAFNAPMAFNVDGLGKGFIIDRAVEVAKRFASSGLLNIGGDIRVWGNYPRRVGVANPRQPAENSPLISQFSLRDAAVATSGGYAR
ncbi:MAG: apbE 3, partial [Verrucomicrobiales bacterium]|nr:apbE 3 [Verrucomicrobiales bacterium]